MIALTVATAAANPRRRVAERLERVRMLRSISFSRFKIALSSNAILDCILGRDIWIKPLLVFERTKPAITHQRIDGKNYCCWKSPGAI
jgi:hypothetical protein